MKILKAKSSRKGIAVYCYDLEISEDMDLLDDARWNKVLKELKSGKYHAAVAAPPCLTFSAVRGKGSYNIRPLRGCDQVTIYGLPDLNCDEKEAVKIGTACARRALDMAAVVQELKPPWVIETPKKQAGNPNLFELPEYLRFREAHNIEPQASVQCPYGSDYQKPTWWLSNIDLNFEAECKHPWRWWTIPWSGESYISPHPKLMGRQSGIYTIRDVDTEHAATI